MRKSYCDLCGVEITCFENTLNISTWIQIARQRAAIQHSCDLCDDCAKRIHRKLTYIENNHTWRHGKRPWED